MYTLIFLLYSLTFAINADQGPTVDPNGGRQLTVHTDEGPGMCPHGGTSAGAYASDRGLGLDPNG